VLDILGVEVIPTVQFWREGKLLWEHRGVNQLEQNMGEGVLYFGDRYALASVDRRTVALHGWLNAGAGCDVGCWYFSIQITRACTLQTGVICADVWLVYVASSVLLQCRWWCACQ
jgi:hypothetical protein